MNYNVILIESDEGFAVSCPTLPGCFSQGETREEALENIRIAIQEWLEVSAENSGTVVVSEEIVARSTSTRQDGAASRTLLCAAGALECERLLSP
jgi:predicted RNase H-like HicB family nuclease